MNAPDRLHALDAVRAFALLGGIVLHATMSFFLPIPAQDSSQSTTLAAVFYVIHIFRMSAFYVIAGFFAHMVLHRRGPRAFVKDRAKRILVPMIGGWMVLAPLTIAVTVWGLTRTFGRQMPAGAEVQAQGIPLTHLWFLYYLCLFYVIALTMRAAFDLALDRAGRVRAVIDTCIRSLLSTHVAPLVLGAPLFVILYFNDTWTVWFGIPTPDMGLTPKIPALIAYGTAFGLGWLVHRQIDLLGCWQRRWHVNLGVALVLTTVCLAIVGPVPAANVYAVPGAPWARLVYAGCYAAAVWFWTFGVIGAALRFCSDESPRRRYLADASYWLYLAHLPIVFFLQVVLMKVPLHWTVKFPLIVAITLAVLLLVYRYLIRPTFIGELLNGRKYPRNGDARAPHEAVAASAAAQETRSDDMAVAELSGASKR